jgi:TetR/AcrR family transcriptional regulator
MTAGERRDQIIGAARYVFITRGFGGSRTRDIAAEAGINESLLYRHFKSKDELFEVAVVEPLQDAISQLIQVSGQPPEATASPRDEMVERTRTFVHDLMDVMQEIAPLLGAMLSSGEDSAADFYAAHVAPFITQVGSVIRLNLDWWDHRRFDPDMIAGFIFGAVWFETIASRLERRLVQADVFSQELAEVTLLGLATRP